MRRCPPELVTVTDNSLQHDSYSVLPDWSPSFIRCPRSPAFSGGPNPRRLRPSRRLIALMRGPTDEEGSLTTSTAESQPQRSQRPVLRRLVDVLPAAELVTAEPPPV